jgi:site-specific DNA recombinase
MKTALFSGRWTSQAPPGFVNIRAKKAEPNIVPVEPAISFIHESFLEFRTGAYTRTELYREMTRRGMRRKNGKEYLLDQFVKILRNPAYIGQIPSEEYGPQPGLHKRIVSDEVYRDVQLILDRKKQVTAPNVKNRPGVPLRSFLLCSACETPLTGGPSTGNRGKTRYHYYYCYRCHSVSVRADAQFVALLGQLPSGEALSSEFQDILKAEWENKVEDEPNIEVRLSRELSQLRQNMKDLVMAHVKNDPAVKPYFEELRQEPEAKITDVQAQISKTEETKAEFTDVMEFSRCISVNLADAWEVAEINQEQRVQKYSVS